MKTDFREMIKNFIKLYRTSPRFNSQLSLYASLFVNVTYALFKAGCGLYYHSWWFGTYAFYYIIISVYRFLLGRNMQSTPLSKEYVKSRRCGVLLLFLTIGLVGLSILITHDGFFPSYNTFILYGMAAYAFYSIIFAIKNMVRYRRYNSPVLSAVRTISLITALVSLYSLQTGMLAKYSHDPAFVLRMNAITGSAVCGITLFTSVSIIIAATMRLKSLKEENQ